VDELRKLKEPSAAAKNKHFEVTIRDGVPVYECSCGKFSTTNKAELKAHMRTHAKKDQEPQPEEEDVE
jgi:hypothetical protein